MKIPSVNISPRVQCGKTAGKTRVSVTQLNSKLHCRDFVRMFFVLFSMLLDANASVSPGTHYLQFGYSFDTHQKKLLLNLLSVVTQQFCNSKKRVVTLVLVKNVM